MISLFTNPLDMRRYFQGQNQEEGPDINQRIPGVALTAKYNRCSVPGALLPEIPQEVVDIEEELEQARNIRL